MTIGTLIRSLQELADEDSEITEIYFSENSSELIIETEEFNYRIDIE